MFQDFKKFIQDSKKYMTYEGMNFVWKFVFWLYLPIAYFVYVRQNSKLKNYQTSTVGPAALDEIKILDLDGLELEDPALLAAVQEALMSGQATVVNIDEDGNFSFENETIH